MSHNHFAPLPAVARSRKSEYLCPHPPEPPDRQPDAGRRRLLPRSSPVPPDVARDRLLRAATTIALILALALIVAGQMGIGPMKAA